MSGENFSDQGSKHITLKKTDHILGNPKSPLTIIEYGDFLCNDTANVEPTIQKILKKYSGKICFVWRHFPLPEHQGSDIVAQISEAASSQGTFWQLHDYLLKQGVLTEDRILKFVRKLGLNVDRFMSEINSQKFKSHVDADIKTGQKNSVEGTPTFFFNGRKYEGPLIYSALNKAAACYLL